MTRRILSTTLLLLLAGCGGGGDGADVAAGGATRGLESGPPPGPGTILFVRATEGQVLSSPTSEIWSIDPDGRNERQLTNNRLVDSDPVFSPDRTKIAYVRRQTIEGGYVDEGSEIFVMNADGSGKTNVSNDPGDDTDPTWSPDGRRILFVSDRDGNSEIYAVAPDGSGLVNLTRNPGNDLDPAFDPDGTKVAFTTDRDGLSPEVSFGFRIVNHEIYVMNPDGSGQTNVTRRPRSSDRLPVFSPDGARIAFSFFTDEDIESDAEENLPRLMVMDANGLDQRDLRAEVVSTYVFTMDGSAVIVATENFIDRIEVDGGGERALAEDALAPVRGPDGRIAFTSFLPDREEVFIMNDDGSGKTRITSGAFARPNDWR